MAPPRKSSIDVTPRYLTMSATVYAPTPKYAEWPNESRPV
jgi:hypothetical protein